MQKIKNAIKGHRHGRDEQDVNFGATGTNLYGDEPVGQQSTAMTGTGYSEGMTGTGYSEGMTGEVVGERPVAVGVAEVPIVVTEQERMAHGHHHEHHHERRGGEVCGQKTFTEVEDRPVIRERVERIVEHRPVEKQYVVETKFVGEQEMGVAGADIVDIKDRVVDVAAPGPTCPVNTGAVMNEVVQGVTGTSTHHHTGRSDIL